MGSRCLEREILSMKNLQRRAGPRTIDPFIYCPSHSRSPLKDNYIVVGLRFSEKIYSRFRYLRSKLCRLIFHRSVVGEYRGIVGLGLNRRSTKIHVQHGSGIYTGVALVSLLQAFPKQWRTWGMDRTCTTALRSAGKPLYRLARPWKIEFTIINAAYGGDHAAICHSETLRGIDGGITCEQICKLRKNMRRYVHIHTGRYVRKRTTWRSLTTVYFLHVLCFFN